MNFRLKMMIGSVTLAMLSGCAHETTTASAPSPDGFCRRTPAPPRDAVGEVSRPWADWLTAVLSRYDCTCPGGKYYGKNDPLCRVPGG